MRLSVALIAILAACSKDDTDTATGDTADTSDTDPDPADHPLVPDEYEYLWNTDSCELYGGGDGTPVYVLAEGAVDSDGHMAMVEQWFWFFGEPDYAGDCVDTFESVGAGVQVGP
jgi:hypothetical protein